MSSSKNENRKDVRFDRSLVIRFRENHMNKTNKWDMTLVRNISKSGIFFNTTSKFKQGTELDIKIHNPVTTRIDDAKGRVVRCLPDKKNTKIFNKTAVKITEWHSDSKRSFTEFIEQSLATI